MISTITSLSDNAQPDDEGWRAQYRAALEDLKTADTEARALQAPDCFGEVHNNVLAAATAYDRAAAQGERGLEMGEPQAYRQAKQTIAEAEQFLTPLSNPSPNAPC
jgi:hypothetical protein